MLHCLYHNILFVAEHVFGIINDTVDAVFQFQECRFSNLALQAEVQFEVLPTFLWTLGCERLTEQSRSLQSKKCVTSRVTTQDPEAGNVPQMCMS